MSHIIFLHGASSSGKSTLARALQAQIELPFWHISIDHLRDAGVLPSERSRRGDFDWPALRPAFFEGFHRSLAAYAGAGNNLILEHILDDEKWLPGLQSLFSPFDVYFIGVHCPLPVLIEREAGRGDRPQGSAQRDFETIHAGKIYDLEVQSLDGVSLNTERILNGWRTGRRDSDFSRSAGAA
ncbi:AAA family ATPase [Nitratireductor sp. ac15]